MLLNSWFLRKIFPQSFCYSYFFLSSYSWILNHIDYLSVLPLDRNRSSTSIYFYLVNVPIDVIRLSEHWTSSLQCHGSYFRSIQTWTLKWRTTNKCTQYLPSTSTRTMRSYTPSSAVTQPKSKLPLKNINEPKQVYRYNKVYTWTWTIQTIKYLHEREKI